MDSSPYHTQDKEFKDDAVEINRIILYVIGIFFFSSVGEKQYLRHGNFYSVLLASILK